MQGDFSDRELARARNLAVAVSGTAWIVLLAGHFRLAPALCPCMGSGNFQPMSSFKMLLDMNPPASLAAGWFLMLAAMMAPALIAPVWHIRLVSFARRRTRSIVLFAAAYSAVWMAVGGVLLAIQLSAELFAPGTLLPGMLTLLIALVWQCTPFKQVCLNRCHAHGPLAAFGLAADLDAIKFGLDHGVYCVGSCWALMLFPMLLPEGHLAWMAIVGLFMCGERLERSRPPTWRVRGIGRALRMIVGQARIYLDAHREASATFSAASE